MVGSTDEGVAVEDAFHVLKVDLVDAQVACALLLMPSERANAREQLLRTVFRHSNHPQHWGPDTIVPIEVRYDGFEAAKLRTSPKGQVKLRPYLNLYIQLYFKLVKPTAACE